MSLTINQNSSTPDLQLTDNKIIMTKNAVEKLGAKPGDRIVINYFIKEDNPIPVIGLSSLFGIDEGNKLTKSLTISFRGEQNKILKMYGTEFVLVPFQKYFKLENIKTKKSEISLEIINK